MLGFNPLETIQIEASVTSATAQFTSLASVDASCVMIDNEGLNTVYACVGDSVAAPTDVASQACPVLPMSTKVLTKGPGKGVISVVTATGTSKVNITPGEGV